MTEFTLIIPSAQTKKRLRTGEETQVYTARLLSTVLGTTGENNRLCFLSAAKDRATSLTHCFKSLIFVSFVHRMILRYAQER